jgi:Family of unknown function (DUF5670)
MVWVMAIVLLLAWAIGMMFHRGGFLHLLLLFALALIVVQIVAGRRAVG